MNTLTKSKRILVTNGRMWSSLSLIRAFGRLGYQVDVIDSLGMAISRFSKYCTKFHKSPEITKDPEAYNQFVLNLV
jgi:hypothetical protein